MWKEFKEFAFKGNVMDMAVGVMIGAAFGAIVTSLVNDIFMPLLGLIVNTKNLDQVFAVLKCPEGMDVAAVKALDLAAAKEAGATVLSYGAFISAVINFILIAVIIFFVVKLIKKVTSLTKKKEEEAPAKEPRLCPYCKSEIAEDATRCPHCTSQLEA
ncbi:MAG: large conductance mechanosensitive channel protein MscL [Clostridia bacterium]|nr:large conductance mechanosensitive channel protein MscL [Clostridia bacterium]